MQDLDLTTSVGEWVSAQPQTARVFEELQIDYCCGGNKPLARVCEVGGLDADAVLTRLNGFSDQPRDDSQPNWADASLSDLCDHIETTHHAFLRTELPRLTQIVEKVADVHGGAHSELQQIRSVFAELRAELEPHMFKEEEVLFPAIRMIEQSADHPRFPFGTVANPIQMMEHEHDNAGAGLKQLRQLTDNYRVPEAACNTWRVMLDGLQNLESDLHQHIHKENNILFPAAKQLESSRLSA